MYHMPSAQQPGAQDSNQLQGNAFGDRTERERGRERKKEKERKRKEKITKMTLGVGGDVTPPHSAKKDEGSNQQSAIEE
jgi:hypothetical protein